MGRGVTIAGVGTVRVAGGKLMRVGAGSGRLGTKLEGIDGSIGGADGSVVGVDVDGVAEVRVAALVLRLRVCITAGAVS